MHLEKLEFGIDCSDNNKECNDGHKYQGRTFRRVTPVETTETVNNVITNKIN